MKHEMAYISMSGNTKKLVNGIAAGFPQSQIIITDLSEADVTGNADIYLIAFGLNRGTVPLRVIEAMDHLSEKTILLFVTCGMEPSSDYYASVERRVEPFLPDHCDYRGLFLCRGQFPEQVLVAAQVQLKQGKNSPDILRIIHNAELSNGHPNEIDVENACQFIRKHLSY